MRTIPLLVLLSLSAGCSHREQVQRDAEATADELQKNVRFLRVSRSAPLLEGESPAASFGLSLTEAPATENYLFPLKAYWLETGGDPDKIPTHDLCGVIERLARHDTAASPGPSTGAEVEIGVNAGPFTGGLSIPVAELLSAAGRFTRIPHSHSLILIRGYADGEHGAWTDTLRTAYAYESVTVLPATDSLNPTTFRLRDTIIDVPNRTYNNRLLPDLRARFIRDVLVLPYLTECEEKYHSEVRILKGFAFSQADQPGNRKVQVFVYVFDNKVRDQIKAAEDRWGLRRSDDEGG